MTTQNELTKLAQDFIESTAVRGQAVLEQLKAQKSGIKKLAKNNKKLGKFYKSYGKKINKALKKLQK